MSAEEINSKRYYDSRLLRFTTQSGFPVKAFYQPEDIVGLDYLNDLSNPGQYPYTRGIYPEGYRKMLWLRSITTACETPEATNAKLKRQIEEGQTGIRLLGDIPTCSGINPDHPIGKYDVGINGTPLWALSELDIELDGIPIEGFDFQSAYDGLWGNLQCYCMLIALCEKRGVPIERLRGSTINDYISSHGFHVFANAPLDISKKVTIDTAEFSIRNTPSWHPFVPCGYDMGETGITAVQGIAFILANAIDISNELIQRGMKFDQFAPRIAFTIHGEMSFFETVCKIRAARKLWARIAKERFGAENPKSCKFICAVRTSGYSLTRQQQINNIGRTTICALSAVFAGAQSIDLTAYDEAHGIPTDEAETVNLAIHQIIAHESDTALVADPLGGSYYVEWLTKRIEEEVEKLIDEIDKLGGVSAALKAGWVEKVWEKEAVKVQRDIDEGRKIVIGLNKFVMPKDKEIQLPVRSHDVSLAQKKTISKFKKFMENRNLNKVRESLLRLKNSVHKGENLIRPTIQAFKDSATIGEVSGMIMEGGGYDYDFFKKVKRPAFLD